ncbi:MAG: energy-coupling factor ABC transporter permease [Deltaproteobacteria bacterium]|nr:energy-coupling factor ABC transporter permease [Candidatus Deferrimicrobium borealis]
MHMADALLSPAVGGTLWAASSGTIAYCSAKVRKELDDRKVPLMGVLGAFLFAAQMINFSIPGTGSSGHLGGGLLLTILLGPHAAFLTIASVLVVQALFFADGGLLALGCNIFNLGFFPAFVAYPYIYKKIARERPGQARITVAAIVAAVAGLQLGAFAVVLETVLSGITSLPFSTFVVLMQPIHLAIGIVEGVVTAAVVTFVYNARPEILQGAVEVRQVAGPPLRNVLLAFLAAAVLTGGVVSWFASGDPDGLEWAIAKTTGKEELTGPEHGIHGMLTALQEKIAFLPDYSFRKTAEAKSDGHEAEGGAKPEEAARKEEGSKLGTSVSGIVGGLITLALAFLAGFLLKRRSQAA